MKAQVLSYSLEKGFGFLVEPNNTRHFFHITNCIGFVPQPGMTVIFEVGQGRRGPAAVNVRLQEAASPLKCGCLGVRHPDCPDHGVAATQGTSAGISALSGDTSKSEVSRG